MATHEQASPWDGVPHPSEHGWDIGAISSALNQVPDITADIAYGSGVRYALADGAVTVELFPPHVERQNSIVRLSTNDSRQEFFRYPAPTVRQDGLIFQSDDHLLSIAAAGHLTQYHSPSTGHQRPVDAPNVLNGPMSPLPDAEDSSDDTVSRQTVSQEPTTAPETQPRVSYSGRLGTDPRTKVTPKRKFVMEFPVAVAVADQEKPEWRHTVVFDAKARALDGVLHKGTAVEVIAYEHHKTKSDPATGRRREVREYYATTVTSKPRAREAASDVPRNPQS